MSSKLLSSKLLISSIAMSALLSVAACDKGPKNDAPAPAPATKTSDTALSEPKAVPSEAKAAEPAARAAGSVNVEGKAYGADIATSEVMSISAIAADPMAYDGKTVRVEGMVTDVCPKRGCWFTMAGDKPGEKMRFKVTDGEMVFPMSAKGEYAVAEGKLVAEELSLEETRAMEEHLAEETGKEFDPESITEGKLVYRIQGTGAVIGKKK